MVIELTAVRAVSPVLGSSVYTWTSVMGVVLLGLAGGNYIGGYFIDKYKSRKTIAIFLLGASFFIGLIPFFIKGISFFILNDFSLLSRILLVSFTLFLLPSFFLGCLYAPTLKLYSSATKSKCLGVQSGVISSLWSLGSIVGTFLTGFFLTGVIGTTNSFLIVSFIFLIFSSILFLGFSPKKIFYKDKKFLLAIIFIVVMLVVILLYEERDKKIIFSDESDYYKISVVDKFLFGKETRLLFLDIDSHGVEDKTGADLDIYTSIYPVISIFKKDVEDIFIIGGGAYDIAKKFYNFYDGVNIIVSEIDPEVTEVAEEFFNLNDYPIITKVGDSRLILGGIDKKFDVVYGDAYNAFISIPWHLVTFQFNELVKNHLKEGGIYILNFMSSLEGDNSEFFDSMFKTFKKTFDNLYVFAYGGDKTSPQNIIFVAVNSKESISSEYLLTKLKEVKGGEKLLDKVVPTETLIISPTATVLTDDFAPVEKLMSSLINNYFNFYSKFFYSIFFNSLSAPSAK